jgi:hypothetical protein
MVYYYRLILNEKQNLKMVFILEIKKILLADFIIIIRSNYLEKNIFKS